MIVRSFLILLMAIVLSSPALAADNPEKITARLVTLTKEYKKLDTHVQKISTFADKAERERASINTLARLLPVMATIRAEIDNLLKQTAALTGGAELAKFEIKANEKTYDGQALSDPVANGDTVAFSAVVPMNGTVAKGQLKWVLLNPEGNPVMGAEKSKEITETEGSVTAKFRLQLTNLQPGRYSAHLTHSVDDKTIKPISDSYSFNIGSIQKISITRLWVTDQPKSETHFNTLEPGQDPVLYVSFDMSAGMDAIHKKLTVIDRSSGKTIVSSEGEKKRSGDSTNQRTGIALSAAGFEPGGRYRFEAVLTSPGGESVMQSQNFEIAQTNEEENTENDELAEGGKKVESQGANFSPLGDEEESTKRTSEPNFDGFVEETNSNTKEPVVVATKREQIVTPTSKEPMATKGLIRQSPATKEVPNKNTRRVSPPSSTPGRPTESIRQPKETSGRSQVVNTQRAAPNRHPNWDACRNGVRDQNEAVKAYKDLEKRAFELNKVFYNKVRSQGKAVNRKLKPIEDISADQYAEIQKLKAKAKKQKLTKQEIRYGNDLVAKHKVSFDQVKALRADRDQLKAFLKKFSADYKQLDCGVFAVNIKNSAIGRKYGYDHQPIYDICNQLKFPKVSMNRAKLTLQQLSCLNSNGQLRDEIRNSKIASKTSGAKKTGSKQACKNALERVKTGKPNQAFATTSNGEHCGWTPHNGSPDFKTASQVALRYCRANADENDDSCYVSWVKSILHKDKNPNRK